MQVSNIYGTLSSATRQYELTRELGSGSFGQVYLSLSSEMPHVAVKVFTDEKEAEIELEIATDICSQNLPGITKLIDSGIVSSF